MEDKEQLKQLVNLFRLIVTNDPAALNQVKTIYCENPSLLVRKLNFSCGPTSDIANIGCACVLDHETFTYISKRKVDKEMLDCILKSIEHRSCRHYHYRGTGPQPTAVNLIHAAAAVSYIPVLELLLKVHHQKAPLTYSLCASPLHLAILLNQTLSVQIIIETKGYDLNRYCDFFRYERRNTRNPNIVDADHLSVFKLCIMMDDLSTAENIVKRTSLRANWVVDAFTSSSEVALKLTLKYIDRSFLKQLLVDQASTILKYAICKGLTELVNILLQKRNIYSGVSLALLAVVYDEPNILKVLLTTKADKGNIIILNYTLLDISDTLGHTECSDILRKQGIKKSKTKSALARPCTALVLLEVGGQLPFRELTDILIHKVAYRIPLNTRLEGGQTLILHSLRYKQGLGIRALLPMGCDVEERGFDGVSPLELVLKNSTHPCSILDILYFNPPLSRFKFDDIHKSEILYRLTEVQDRQQLRNISILTLAIVRDLKNYSVLKREFDYSGFASYEGSMAVLLIDCGYDVRLDEQIHVSYSRILAQKGTYSCRENEIRVRILDRIINELYHPKPLKEGCRDVIRRSFTGQGWVRFLGMDNMPVSVRNFILMEERLKRNYQKCRFHTEGSICSIDEEGI